MSLPLGLLTGLVLSVVIAAIALRRGSLSASGVAGAIVVGTIVFGFGGLPLGVVLVMFFVLSSLLTRLRAEAKREVVQDFAKGGRRDLGQVLANGGVAAALALLWWVAREPGVVAAYAGAMATATADTWATELGVLSPSPPRLVTTWKSVRAGTSGGVSPLGTAAAACGAAVIAVTLVLSLQVCGLLGLGGLPPGVTAAPLALAAWIGGVVGSTIDSLLGATVQAMYYSPRRGKETERRIDPDGSTNRHARGWRWLGNDWVNFVSTAGGAAAAAQVLSTMTR